MSTPVVMMTIVCEEDAGWLPQYLTEAGRLGFPLLVTFHGWGGTPELRRAAARTWRREGAFDERWKQDMADHAKYQRDSLLVGWDVDETWESGAREVFLRLAGTGCDYVLSRWVQLHGDVGHERADPPFGSVFRARGWKLHSGFRWRWTDPKVNGPSGKLVARYRRRFPVPISASGPDCLHHGMMTEELRRFHRERWDRIYAPNPYKFWQGMCEQTPEVRPYP